MLAGHAGGVFNGGYTYMKSNAYSYLTNGYVFWTMTPAEGYNPYGASHWASDMILVHVSDFFDDYNTSNTFGLRSVINICSDVKITGSVTKIDPYIVS